MFDTYRLMDIILGILIFCIMIFIIKKQGLLEKYIDALPEANGANKCDGSHSRIVETVLILHIIMVLVLVQMDKNRMELPPNANFVM